MDLVKELEQKRDNFVTGFFWLAFNTIFIFGIPAILAAFVGKKLNMILSMQGIQFALLFFAFFGSWAITIHLYRKKLAILRTMDAEIKQARLAAQNVVTSNFNGM
jgi:hypothetical protein